MALDFTVVLIFMVVGALFVLVNVTISRIVQPRVYSKEKLTSYECGEETIGEAWIQFNNRFYLVALIFIIFDVEIVFLYPWAVIFKKLGAFAFVEMMIFVGILLVGLAYVWAKGDLGWVRSYAAEGKAQGIAKPEGVQMEEVTAS
jgi:NADH-quinone oxidoreductase subunit A